MALIRSVALLIAAFLLAPLPAHAQFDPRPTLNNLIFGFQNCGPATAFQSLSPAVWQLVYMQTGGRGCYALVASLGAPQGMQIVDSRQFPIGPLYAVRVNHQAGSADWFIGFNQMTGKVEYLNFQPTQTGAAPPSTGTGPEPTASGPSAPPPSTPSTGSGDGCDLYPAMCQ